MSRTTFNALSLTTLANLSALHAALCAATDPMAPDHVNASARIETARSIIGASTLAPSRDRETAVCELAEALAFVDRAASGAAPCAL